MFDIFSTGMKPLIEERHCSFSLVVPAEKQLSAFTRGKG
jgi:hypothetical protein